MICFALHRYKCFFYRSIKHGIKMKIREAGWLKFEFSNPPSANITKSEGQSYHNMMWSQWKTLLLPYETGQNCLKHLVI